MGGRACWQERRLDRVRPALLGSGQLRRVRRAVLGLEAQTLLGRRVVPHRRAVIVRKAHACLAHRCASAACKPLRFTCSPNFHTCTFRWAVCCLGPWAHDTRVHACAAQRRGWLSWTAALAALQRAAAVVSSFGFCRRPKVRRLRGLSRPPHLTRDVDDWAQIYVVKHCAVNCQRCINFHRIISRREARA
eukprot:6214107-Pleurochrysis_carterae.AAC.8